MDIYREMYVHLFNAVTDALNAIENYNYGTAETLLKEAQKWSEERYIEQPTYED